MTGALKQQLDRTRTFRSRSALNEITGVVIDSAMTIHSDLGHGLLESSYERILERALHRRGLFVQRQLRCDFEYDAMLFRNGIRIDLLVEHSVVVELKAEAASQRAHARQVLSYLRLLHLPVGLLINFGAPHLRDGIHRLINGSLDA